MTDFTALAGNGLEGRIGESLIHGGSGKFIATLANVDKALQEQADREKLPVHIGVVEESDTPNWLPSPSNASKRGVSSGVLIIRISRIPASIIVLSG